MKHAYDSSFISPSYFQDNFSVDGFLITLTKDVIDPQKRLQHNSNSRALTTGENAQASIDRVQQLLRRFARAEEEIGVLSSEVSGKLARLQLDGRHLEEEYKAEVKVLERVGERIKGGIRDIDSRVSHISQTATRIGDRLQTAESLRVRCLEAQELVSHLQAFSCHTAGEDFSQLPPIFTNQATMAEAAAVSRRLLLLVGEVLAAKQRTKLAAPMDLHHMTTPGNTGGLGSVEHTLKVLESYCNWLENRVISWFDTAVADNNLVLQGQCASIMRQLDKEKSITQRWVASRPMFLALSPEMLDDWLRKESRSAPATRSSSAKLCTPGSFNDRPAAAGASQPQQPAEQVDENEDDVVIRLANALSNLYKEMHAAVKDEVQAAQQVFPQPDLALELFVNRLLEQHVQATLERLLLPGSMGMTALAAAAAATAASGPRTTAAASSSSPGPASAAAASAESASPSKTTAGAGSATSRVASFKERATSLAASLSAASFTGGAAAAAAANALSVQQEIELQRLRLRLLSEAYGRTARLAVNLERAVRTACQLDVVNMAEGLWPTFMGDYPQQELAWLQAAVQAEVARQDSPELSLLRCKKIMSWNKEATARCLKLSPPGQGPRNCCMLFYHLVTTTSVAPVAAAVAGGPGGPSGSPAASGGAGQAHQPDGFAASGPAAPAAPAAHPGCLLDQLARQLLEGIEYSLELCNSASSGSISSMLRMGFGAVSSASSHQVAVSFVNDKIRKALEAAHVAGDIVSAVQAHFSAVVVPALSGSVGELSAASSALLALMRAAEDSITVVLRKSVDACISQLDRLLSSEQRRSDFLPRDEELTFDRPTAACLLGTALLTALGQAAQETLDGTNLRQFLAEVARRAYHLLLLHMTRYTYSPTGALKWKKDVSEYAEVLCSYQVPAANEDMSHLQQLVNVLVVAPDSLLGLVNGSLRMSHRDALRFISLREDFRTAKVQGKSLLQLFSGEGMEKHIGQMTLGAAVASPGSSPLLK